MLNWVDLFFTISGVINDPDYKSCKFFKVKDSTLFIRLANSEKKLKEETIIEIRCQQIGYYVGYVEKTKNLGIIYTETIISKTDLAFIFKAKNKPDIYGLINVEGRVVLL